jgi:RimJ/RimL family protein N-acetyltransferase
MNAAADAVTWKGSQEQEAMLFTRSTKIDIRPAAVTDLTYLIHTEDAGSAIEPASVQQLTRWLRTAEQGPRRRRGKRLWTVFHVAATRQRVVGHGVLVGEDEEAMLRIVVHPHFRREGIGRRLVDVLCRAAHAEHALEMVQWIVHERHAATIDFARSCGFRPREVRPLERAWFGPGNDGYVFVLPLVPPTL